MVFVGSAGGPDAILFWQLMAGFGAQDTPLVGNCCFADQVFLRELGDKAVGIRSFSYWAEGRDSTEVQEFVKAYERSYDRSRRCTRPERT